MCGIVGYIGNQDCKEILLKGLEKLEYRGYDSAGIALLNEKGVKVCKEKGRIADLRAIVETKDNGIIGIGHTRWATHGEPNKVNAHPHQSTSERFTLVHNGVIENYHEVQEEYLKDVTMKSETDTEVIVQLIEKFVNEGLSTKLAFAKTLKVIKGSYALALIDSEDPHTLYAAKNKSPLLIGAGEEENLIVSDAMASINVTKEYIEIHDEEIVTLTKRSRIIEDLEGNIIHRNSFTASIDESDIEKGTYPHFMLKEIDEQPFGIRNILTQYKGKDTDLEIDPAILAEIKKADRLYIVACGTSYHAGLVGKGYLEQWAKVPTEVHVASEFGYNMPLLSEKPLFVFISQSGETADSRQVLKKVKEMGYPALTITNVKGSTLSREADHTLLLHVGPEIAVASTKAYTAQIAVLSILAASIAKNKGITLDFDLQRELAIVANAMEQVCQDKEAFEHIVSKFLPTTRNAFFIGRGYDFCVSLEASLKLKEISYIQTEGFAGGELKHGTIALIEKGTPVFAITTQKHVDLHTRGNVKEVVARGAFPCIISMEGMEAEGDSYVLPKVHEHLSPLISVIVTQLVSYYAALSRDCDIDKPRNLAKSVTVE